jgi:hypothetical protein
MKTVCPGCGAEIDEQGKATFDGKPVEGDITLRERVEELENELRDAQDALDDCEGDASGDDADETDNPFFRKG